MQLVFFSNFINDFHLCIYFVIKKIIKKNITRRKFVLFQIQQKLHESKKC